MNATYKNVSNVIVGLKKNHDGNFTRLEVTGESTLWVGIVVGVITMVMCGTFTLFICKRRAPTHVEYEGLPLIVVKTIRR